MRQTIYKNTFWLSASTGINKLLALALIIYAARALGAEGYGQFTFALAFASLLMIFSDLGLSAIVIREFAREKENREEFYSLISLKILLAFGSFIIIVGTSLFLVGSPEIRSLILLLGSFLLMNSLIGIAYAFFHAQQKMEYEAGLEIIQMVLMVSLGIFVLFQFPSPQNLSYAYLVSGAVSLIATFIFFNLKVFTVKLKWNIAVWKKYLKMSWPLAFIGLFGVVYTSTDSVMLGYLNMFEETGWYNAAQKIVLAGLVPMGLIGAAFYPALSKFSRESKEKLQRAWNSELEIMIVLALPLVVGGMVLAPKIISSFYPLGFTPSILAFQILIGSAGLIFLYRPMYDIMIVLDQQAKTFWITMAGAAVNVVLNFVLIPRYSLYGAASATVVTYFLVLLLIMIFVQKFTFIRLPVFRIVLTFFVSVLSVSFMYFILKYLGAYNIFLVVLVGAVVYFSIFLVIRKYILLGFFRQAYV
ncbi:flippase [Patescibacteria group bacterium]|nr:flippase [Patescibacteria group bacterium]